MTGTVFNVTTAGIATIIGGTINNAVIGGTTPAAGTFSTLDSGAVTITGGAIDGVEIGIGTPVPAAFTALAITTQTTPGVIVNDSSGNLTSVTGIMISSVNAADGIFSTLESAAVTLTGGSIDGVNIGDFVTGRGTFTSLGIPTYNTPGVMVNDSSGRITSTTSLTIGSLETASIDVTGGSIDGTEIGIGTPAPLAVTNLKCNQRVFANMDWGLASIGAVSFGSIQSQTISLTGSFSGAPQVVCTPGTGATSDPNISKVSVGIYNVSINSFEVNLTINDPTFGGSVGPIYLSWFAFE